MITEITDSSFLSSIVTSTRYDSGQLKECMLGSPYYVATQYGSFVAHYDDGGDRTRYCNSISFYNNGSIKRLALHDQVEIRMKSAAYIAQNLVFHPSGLIKRIFPLNGKTTGFWTEANEYNLAENTRVVVGDRCFEEKVISVQFYESEQVKSITFWPQARPEVRVAELVAACRHGISFDEEGNVSSFEPAKPVPVQTPIGCLNAYDSAPVGVHGDLNSLRFDRQGNVIALKNSTDRITVLQGGKVVDTIKHDRAPHWCNENLTMPVPMDITFQAGMVTFGNDKSYTIENYEFQIEQDRIKVPVFAC